ncbi:MAG TPA: hypothetical protein VGR57_16810 [Ktedonobacterales bacterium]|nr:hypothetical protein [Ktedonobacterales bacterium]
MANLLGVLARARRYAPLTPLERAALRLIEGLLYVALVGAATAGAQYLAGPAGAGHGGLDAIDWAGVARVCLAGGAVAVLLALAKYFKAHGDPALGQALGEAVGALAERVGPAPSPDPSPPAAGEGSHGAAGEGRQGAGCGPQ